MAVRDLSSRLFRRCGKATLQTASGETLAGRGVVSALKRDMDEPGGRRSPAGTLSRPLYRFLGTLPGLENSLGGTLTQAGKTYTVLDAREILLGEREVCVRALLERRDEDGIE